ncbi:hypothetical protein GJR96_07380 [Haloferax sp. MBLA0076]|uniref:Ig-like domain-containing protein n=1 Tax=Haloferax litoreum TaxID=2666140 RepID=A0A6A8GI25_9EURY|nr:MULTISPECIES: hypothetical protein [Haloferax]KAB1193278.1 hypothetical protein Hfx1148_07375 [Haloferax sp. CBA1148]MRX21777.1 hypothetical protein [Haloferax litoreum]
MDRRTLLSLVASGVAGLAGCGSPEGETETETPTPEEGTGEPTAVTTADASVQRILSVWNPTPDPVFTTLVVTRGSRDVFFENVDLVPGERTVRRVDVPPDDVEVLVQTDTGIRSTSTWATEETLDGLEVVLGRESAEFWRTVSCRPNRECAVDDGGETVDLPLVGDGSGRWYAPAGVVVENPGDETTARLRVDLFDSTLLDRTYRLPSQTRLSVPVSYRTGTYRVALETDEMEVETPWQVPDEPTKYVDTESGTTGCGPANTTLTVANRDDRPHRLTLRIESDSETFEQTINLEAGETRDFVPMVESGPKRVFASTETGAETEGMWWSCPPRGTASVVVDATGSLTLRAAGPKPG